MNKIIGKTLILLATISLAPLSMAETVQKPLMLRAETNAANMEMVIKDNFIKAKYASADNRFLQRQCQSFL